MPQVDCDSFRGMTASKRSEAPSRSSRRLCTISPAVRTVGSNRTRPRLRTGRRYDGTISRFVTCRHGRWNRIIEALLPFRHARPWDECHRFRLPDSSRFRIFLDYRFPPHQRVNHERSTATRDESPNSREHGASGNPIAPSGRGLTVAARKARLDDGGQPPGRRADRCQASQLNDRHPCKPFVFGRGETNHRSRPRLGDKAVDKEPATVETDGFAST